MKLAINETEWTENPAIASHWPVEGGRCFALVGRSEVIVAEVIGGKLALYPERSAQHRALKAALGNNEA